MAQFLHFYIWNFVQS